MIEHFATDSGFLVSCQVESSYSISTTITDADCDFALLSPSHASSSQAGME
jgi:hypothetical protein